MHEPVEPSITKQAFSCPHCGAYTSQQWFRLRAKELDDDSPVPSIPDATSSQEWKNAEDIEEDFRSLAIAWCDKMATGLVFLEEDSGGQFYDIVHNLHLSQCYTCKKISAWIHERLAFPSHKAGALPNTDLPEDIIRDFEEARGIIDLSPRGAAALLRLCIQKLCAHLGEKGKNINDDIAALVGKGLNPLVQQTLDVVRVIGNDCVHPGKMDLRDDRATAMALLDLVNAIADQMISHPKKVKGMYDSLPESTRKAIEARNQRALDGKTQTKPAS